jgi:hypothetical protein
MNLYSSAVQMDDFRLDLYDAGVLQGAKQPRDYAIFAPSLNLIYRVPVAVLFRERPPLATIFNNVHRPFTDVKLSTVTLPRCLGKYGAITMNCLYVISMLTAYHI